MWFKDAVLKALGEAAGKFAAEAQALLVAEARGLVWRELKFDNVRFYPYHVDRLISHLSKYGKELYSGASSILNNADPTRKIASTVVYRYKGSFILVRRSSIDNLSIFYPKGFDLDKLLKVAATQPPSTYTGQYDKDGNLNHNSKQISLKRLHPGKEHIALEADLQRWLQGEAVFREAGLPHRRGWLPYGKPGNGKTTCVQQLAVKYDMHIDVAIFKRGHLVTAPLSTKRFLLIEDVDNIFRGRQALNPDADFGNFLNAIDGVNDLDNCIVVITTNDLSAIDPAIGRPRDET